MNVVLFGATGMVGQGVLRECLLDPEVTQVLSVGRTPLEQPHPKLVSRVHKDMMDFTALQPDLVGMDACFFCLGVSSAGMDEPAYTRITYDFTLAAAHALLKSSPQATFIYVSGQSTDSTEKGSVMWARVKGRTENALLRMPFKAAYMFRPGAIQPLHGIVSKTPAYRVMYTLTRPLWPVVRALFPRHVVTTEQLGKVMLRVARTGAPRNVLEATDLTALVPA